MVLTHSSNAGVRSFGGSGLSPYANCEVESGRVVLIESQLFLREILGQALSTCMPRIQIDSVGDSEHITPGPARLVLIGISSGLDVDTVRFTVETARALCDDSPVAVVLHDDEPSLVRTLRTLGVVGIIQHTTSLAIAIAAVRLMIVGGVFLPPESACEHTLPLPTQWARRPDNCATQPEMSELDGVSRNDAALTAREWEVLKILREGRQNKLIAFELGISENTVKVHLRNIMKKLHVSNRTQVVLGAGVL
jgi:DNA-binding NarL/FixJ family response regulator